MRVATALSLTLAGCGGVERSDDAMAAEHSIAVEAGTERVALLPSFAPQPPDTPRMMALVDGTFVIRDDCAWLEGGDGTTKTLILWPRGATLWRDADGYFVETGGRRLRESTYFRSGGGWIPLDGRDPGLDIPERCRADDGVVIYSPVPAVAEDAMPLEEPPPPPGSD